MVLKNPDRRFMFTVDQENRSFTQRYSQHEVLCCSWGFQPGGTQLSFLLLTGKKIWSYHRSRDKTEFQLRANLLWLNLSFPNYPRLPTEVPVKNSCLLKFPNWVRQLKKGVSGCRRYSGTFFMKQKGDDSINIQSHTYFQAAALLEFI